MRWFEGVLRSKTKGARKFKAALECHLRGTAVPPKSVDNLSRGPVIHKPVGDLSGSSEAPENVRYLILDVISFNRVHDIPVLIQAFYRPEFEAFIR